MAAQLKNEVCAALESSVEELQNIWDYIGYNEPDRTKRAKEVSDRIQKIFFDIIEEENRFRLELESRVETKKRELAEFSQELGLKPFFPPRGLSTYRLLDVLDEKFKELVAMRQARIDQFQDLKKKAELYCQRLDIKDSGLLLQHTNSQKSADITGDKGEKVHLPTDDELQLLSDKVKELEQTYKGLLSKYVSLREDLIRIADDIDYSPSNEFEHAVLSKPEGMENGDTVDGEVCNVVLTNATLDDLQQWRLRLVKQKAMLVGTCDELRSYLMAMWARLQLAESECETFLEANAGYKPSVLEALQGEVDRCQEMKWERSAQYLKNLRSELRELSIKCCVDGPSSRKSSVSVLGSHSSSSDDDNEDSINTLEQEIDRLRELYNRNKTMYDAVYNYQRLWQQYLEVEVKMKDPAILSNRGGILLKTDKEKKRLLKELPRVEQEVSDEISVFEQQNKSSFLLPGGRTFADHVRKLWSDHRDGQRSASATRDRRRLKTAANESPSASPRRKA